MNQTIYHLLGSENLKLLVDNFYDLVIEHGEIKHLFVNDITEIKRKQYYFLTQFLGGPDLYTENIGQPKMRMRHMPHKITEKSKEAWLECMRLAIDKLPIEQNFKFTLYNCFPMLASHMVNS